MAEPRWRRWRWGAGAFLVVFVPLALGVASRRDVYESTTTVLVESAHIPAHLVQSVVTSPLEARLHILKQEILSRAHLEQAIAEFKLYQEGVRGGTSMQHVIDQMRADLEIQVTRGVLEEQDREAPPVSFTVRYRGRDPQQVALVAQRIANELIRLNLELRAERVTGTARFFREQLEVVGNKLKAQEETIQAFRARYGPTVPAPAWTDEQLMLLEYEVTKEAFGSIARRALEANLAEAMEKRQKGEQFRVIMPAMPADHPVGPRRSLLYGVALGLASTVGVAVALAVGARERSKAQSRAGESSPS